MRAAAAAPRRDDEGSQRATVQDDNLQPSSVYACFCTRGEQGCGPEETCEVALHHPVEAGPGHLRAGITGIVGLEVDAGVVMGLLCSDATLHGCRIDTDFDLITRTRTQLPATLALPLAFLEVKREIAMQT